MTERPDNDWDRFISGEEPKDAEESAREWRQRMSKEAVERAVFGRVLEGEDERAQGS